MRKAEKNEFCVLCMESPCSCSKTSRKKPRAFSSTSKPREPAPVVSAVNSMRSGMSDDADELVFANAIRVLYEGGLISESELATHTRQAGPLVGRDPSAFNRAVARWKEQSGAKLRASKVTAKRIPTTITGGGVQTVQLPALPSDKAANPESH